MYRFLIVVMISLSVGYGCKKENSVSTPVSAQDTFKFTATFDDGEGISKSYLPNQINEFSEYSFSGMAGTYFGYRSTFQITDIAKIDITFGTLLSTDPELKNVDIMKLIAPGEKIFGSLGSYTSYPQLKPNRVEIAYTDGQSVRWCSTKITEERHDEGVEIEVEVKQNGSSFIVDKVKEFEVKTAMKSYRVEGHFDCILYEMNGKHKKKIKGSFSGVISATP